MQLKDEQMRRSLAPQFVQKDENGKITGFDNEGLYSSMLSQGADPMTINTMRMKQVELQKALLGLNDEQRGNAEKQHGAITDALQSVQKIYDQESKTAQPATQQAQPSQPGVSGAQPTAPGTVPGAPGTLAQPAASESTAPGAPAAPQPATSGSRPIGPKTQMAYQQQLINLAKQGVDVSRFQPVLHDAADLEDAEAQLGSFKETQSLAEQQAKTAEASGKGAQGQAAAQKDLADAALTNLKVKGGNMTPTDIHSAVASVIPQNWPDPSLALRTEQRMIFAQAHGDLEGVQSALKDASAEVGTIQKETNPAVQANKIATAREEGIARASVEAQVARGSNAALAQVPPHLVGPATSDATKAGEEFAQSKSVSDRLAAMMDDAKKGNVVSYQLLPQEGALQLVTSQGIKRINMAEIQNYGGGSLWQKMEGHIGKALTGESIPSSVLSDMGEMQDIQRRGSTEKYNNSLKTINQNYGSNFKPVTMENTVGAGTQGTASTGKAVSLAAAKALPQNAGKSDDEIIADIKKYGHTVAP